MNQQQREQQQVQALRIQCHELEHLRTGYKVYKQAVIGGRVFLLSKRGDELDECRKNLAAYTKTKPEADKSTLRF